MRRTIHVALGENARDLGTLRFDADGARENAAFDYDAGWLAAEDRFAIDPGLGLVRGPQFHRKERGGSVFPGAIADTEPDGWARRVILRDRARRRQDARRAGAEAGSEPHGPFQDDSDMIDHCSVATELSPPPTWIIGRS